MLGYFAHDQKKDEQTLYTKIESFRSVHDVVEIFAEFIKGVSEDVTRAFAQEKTKKASSWISPDRAILVGVYQASKKPGPGFHG